MTRDEKSWSRLVPRFVFTSGTEIEGGTRPERAGEGGGCVNMGERGS